MTTNFSLSQTLASAPKCFLKTPMVPGPHTSWVMSTSTFTQTFSFGATASRPAARARIFSVSVIGGGISVELRGKSSERGRGGRRVEVAEQVGDRESEPGEHVPAGQGVGRRQKGMSIGVGVHGHGFGPRIDDPNEPGAGGEVFPPLPVDLPPGVPLG